MIIETKGKLTEEERYQLATLLLKCGYPVMMGSPAPMTDPFTIKIKED